MKKILFFAAAFACALSFQSCGNEDNVGEYPISEAPTTTVFEADFTYDFAAAAAKGENPANLNGSAKNGQAFYAWESASKTHSKRQDYKGYTWAEGSVLPEECHVWRRSDRINGNVKDGGLQFTNAKDVAIDGLEEGDIVRIYFEGEENILWVPGTGDEGAGAVAEATIGEVEAVIGETEIASGAEIVVTKVTPAENGTGYIVVNVKKGTVITKIEIGKYVTYTL